MKNEMQSVLRKIEFDLTAPALQARRISPMGKLFAARNTRKFRVSLPARNGRGLTIDDRKLAAARRAAEMTAWDVTGGDFLVTPKIQN